MEWQPQGTWTDIGYETAEGIAKITIRRPEVRNAFRPKTLFELKDAFELARDDPAVGVVVLTVHEDQETIFEAIKAGASGYLPKSATLDDIRSAVKAVAAGGSFLDPVQARKLLHQFNRYADETKAAADIYYLLTGREREILALLAEGLTSRQIASQLVISERTVNTHIGNIYRKLHVNNRVDAVREAMRIRLVEPPR